MSPASPTHSQILHRLYLLYIRQQPRIPRLYWRALRYIQSVIRKDVATITTITATAILAACPGRYSVATTGIIAAAFSGASALPNPYWPPLRRPAGLMPSQLIQTESIVESATFFIGILIAICAIRKSQESSQYEREACM